MKENLYYFEINGQFHFVHEHTPEENKGIPYIFLNAVFDEKKRSQKFYAETARAFCKNGIPVLRFDYYGTDDSCGQLYEMDFNNIQLSILELLKNVHKRFGYQKVNLFGLRMGADLALIVAEKYPSYIEKIVLIEPIVIGKRYLTEQRSRRKMFYKINNMTDVQENIIIDGKMYEDHQGYPISENNIQFIDHLDSTKKTIIQKNILLIKLNTIASRKTIAQLKERLEDNNSVSFINYQCDDFWANLEPINTINLSKKVVKEAMNLNIFNALCS